MNEETLIYFKNRTVMLNSTTRTYVGQLKRNQNIGQWYLLMESGSEIYLNPTYIVDVMEYEENE